MKEQADAKNAAMADEINLEKELVVAPTGQLENLEFVTVILYQPANSDSGGGRQ